MVSFTHNQLCGVESLMQLYHVAIENVMVTPFTTYTTVYFISVPLRPWMDYISLWRTVLWIKPADIHQNGPCGMFHHISCNSSTCFLINKKVT